MRKNILENRKGFTMVELLVALAIFSVVIVGVIEVFGNSYKSYVVQDEVAEVQQNLRMARSLIEQDLRMTGSGIGSKDKDGNGGFVFLGGYNFQGEVGDVVPITFENGGEGESDKLTINYVNWATGCGVAPTGTTLLACDELSILHLNEAMPAASAELKVKEDLKDDSYADWDSGCYCGGKTYPSPKLGFMAIITDSQDSDKSDVVIITQSQPNSSKLQNSPTDYDLNGDGTIDNKTEKFDNKVANTFSDDSTIQFFHPEFAVAATYELTTDGTLLRTDKNNISVPIADNIEDLQFAFCGDFDGSGTADCPQDITQGEWIYKDADLDADGDLSADDRDLVRFIHISLLGRTAKTHSKDLTSKRPELGDRAAGDTDDHFRRRLIQTTIELRNMGL
ncbi:MAG: PilW family protein [Desulfococcaceae bacterium]